MGKKATSLLVVLILFLVSNVLGQNPRARDLGVPFEGEPGEWNAITDVPGILVGHSTIIKGEGKNIRGEGPVRTGVTAIFPRGKKYSPVYANWYSLNGNGEMTGTHWITESGFLETPIMITNTNSVGVVRDAVLKWFVEEGWFGTEEFWYTYPIVAETYDGFLNDIYGFHVTEGNVREAIANSSNGAVAEGNVGGGTGMMCLGFKGGIGTSSREVFINDDKFTLGVLVQANFGAKDNFTVRGVPVGRELRDTLNYVYNGPPDSNRKEGDGSVIVIVATDAPLLPHQLKRIAQRVPIGLGVVGGRGYNGSGDIFLAFSTANKGVFNRDKVVTSEVLSNDIINPLFDATVQAVEESVINAMVAAETMTGINGNTAYALPHDLLKEVLKRYNRIDNSADEPRINLELDEFTGKYRVNPEVFIYIREKGNKLKLRFTGGPEMDLVYQDENVFTLKNSSVNFNFIREENGRIVKIMIDQKDNPVEAIKVE